MTSVFRLESERASRSRGVLQARRPPQKNPPEGGMGKGRRREPLRRPASVNVVDVEVDG